MKQKLILIAAAAAVVALAAVFLVDWNPGRSRREAFIYRCNEEGAGGTFTSREYCAALYARSREGGASRNSKEAAHRLGT